MKQINLLATYAIVALIATSCDFTEECLYKSRLNVHNNWQNYEEVPETNQVVGYGTDNKKWGPVKTNTGANGRADSTSFILPFGNYKVLTYTTGDFSLRTKIDLPALDDPETAFAYVETEPVDLQDGRNLYNPQFPGYFYTSYNTGDLNVRIPVSCAAIQRQHTRFARFLYNIVYQYNGNARIKSLTTDLTGVATQIRLKSGEGVPESAATVYAKPEWTALNDSQKGEGKSYYANQISALSFLPATPTHASVNNTIKVNALMDDFTIRSASLNLTDYFDTFDGNFVTIKIDVVVEDSGMHLELAAWELGIWKEFIIK